MLNANAAPTDAPERDDASLMAGIARGMHADFRLLVERHSDRFYALAYRTLLDRAEAEDVVQEAFLKLWDRPQTWDPSRGAAFTTWFYRLVVNLCLDRRRKKRPGELPENYDAADDSPGADDHLAARQQQAMLQKALLALPERQRMALNLCFYEGLSNQQAADAMGLKLKALQSLLVRGRENLKISLTPLMEAAR